MRATLSTRSPGLVTRQIEGDARVAAGLAARARPAEPTAAALYLPGLGDPKGPACPPPARSLRPPSSRARAWARLSTTRSAPATAPTTRTTRPPPLAALTRLVLPLPAAEVAAFLRSLTGLVAADDESAVDTSRPDPLAVDAKAWIAWTLGGLHACALTPDAEGGDIGGAKRRRPWVPWIRVMVAEARRVAPVVAMHRHAGNITHASEALGTSRRALREALQRAETYP